jgi:hypothetical protein
MDRLDMRRSTTTYPSIYSEEQQLFRAIVPVRSYGSKVTTEMPVPVGLATTAGRAAAGQIQILKMGGVCKRWFGRRYGLQIFFFP